METRVNNIFFCHYSRANHVSACLSTRPRDVVVNAEARAERVVMAAQAGDSLTIQAFLAAGGDVETRDSRMGMVSESRPPLVNLN